MHFSILKLLKKCLFQYCKSDEYFVRISEIFDMFNPVLAEVRRRGGALSADEAVSRAQKRPLIRCLVTAGS